MKKIRVIVVGVVVVLNAARRLKRTCVGHCVTEEKPRAGSPRRVPRHASRPCVSQQAKCSERTEVLCQSVRAVPQCKPQALHLCGSKRALHPQSELRPCASQWASEAPALLVGWNETHAHVDVYQDATAQHRTRGSSWPDRGLWFVL